MVPVCYKKLAQEYQIQDLFGIYTMKSIPKNYYDNPDK